MPEGIDVLVEDGTATLDFTDKSKRGPALAALIATGMPPELIKKHSRSGPRALYSVPEEDARAAGLLDEPTVDSFPERQDLQFAAALKEANDDLNALEGAYSTPMPNVAETAYSGSGTVSGPLRPNKAVADPDAVSFPNVREVPLPGQRSPEHTLAEGSGHGGGVVSLNQYELQTYVDDNTPNPADYAPQKGLADEDKPVVGQGTLVTVSSAGDSTPAPATAVSPTPELGGAPSDGQAPEAKASPSPEITQDSHPAPKASDDAPSQSWARKELDLYAQRVLGVDTTGLPNKGAVLKVIKSGGK